MHECTETDAEQQARVRFSAGAIFFLVMSDPGSCLLYLDPYPYWPPLIPGLKHLVATRPAVLLPRPHAHLAKICVRPKFNFDQGTRKQIMQFGCWGLGRALRLHKKFVTNR